MNQQDILAVILGYLQQAAQITSQVGTGDVARDAAIAASFVAIAQAAIAAHKAQTGQPLDLSLLSDIEPIT